MSSGGACYTAPVQHSLQLVTGRLDLAVHRAELPFGVLCGLAARRNPRRAFLFVSKVLGRHIPVRPSVMLDTHARLARLIPADLPGPVVVMGLAETAIALGQGVHAAWVRQTGRDDAIYLHSTRYRLDQPVAFTFEESHSHASRHIVYRPTDPEVLALFRGARSLVIVDDEATTGATFVHLAEAFGGAVERIVCVTLTNWAQPFEMPAPTEIVSLLDGSFTFAPDPQATPPTMPNVIGNNEPKDHLLRRNRGRQGVREAIDWAGTIPDLQADERILVLGSGEFTWLPVCFAAKLEAAGADVWCQSTTRSPVQVGHDIAVRVDIPDNYGDGIPNFLYNFRRGDYDRVILCHETPADLLPPALLDVLGATSLEM